MKAVRSITLVTLAVVLFLSTKTFAGSGLIQVPILWCALKGTDLAAASEADRNRELWRLHELPTDWVFARANFTLRSELVWDLMEAANFKVIEDPDKSTGAEGDIASADELQKAQADCRKAYEAERDVRQVALQGIVALYVRRLRYIRNTITPAPPDNFFFGVGINGTPTGDMCSNPSTVTQWVDAYLALEETVRSAVSGANPNQFGAVTALAHEFGHALSLRHGNGQDELDDGAGNTTVDDDGLGGCGAGEQGSAFVCRLPWTIMNASASECFATMGREIATTHITPEQIAQLQQVARAVPGKVEDPPRILVPGPVVSDYRSDAREDVALRRVDLAALIVAHDSNAATTSFIYRLNGLTDRERLALSYAVFVDLDGNPATGGRPSDITFDTVFDSDFTGAELVAEVIFANTGEPEFPTIEPVARVWKFQGSSFVRITDPRIMPAVQTIFDSKTGGAVFDTVGISIPDEIIGAMTTPLRLQAMAQDPGGEEIEEDGAIDRLPDDRAAGVNVWLVPARYPACEVVPGSVAQGRQATVTASFPLPNTMVKVVLGDEMVGQGTTDGAGEAMVAFTIPTEARTGPRLVTVGMATTALTADCTVMVEEAPPNTAPDCSGVVASASILWPANHKLLATEILGVTDADNDPVTITVTEVTQDEPVDGLGDGDASPDAVLQGAEVWLRAERSGRGNGRVYQVTFQADDGRGGQCTGVTTVCVPHDRRKGSSCIDDGQQHNSLEP
jgi:hypothetical protein